MTVHVCYSFDIFSKAVSAGNPPPITMPTITATSCICHLSRRQNVSAHIPQYTRAHIPQYTRARIPQYTGARIPQYTSAHIPQYTRPCALEGSLTSDISVNCCPLDPYLTIEEPLVMGSASMPTLLYVEVMTDDATVKWVKEGEELKDDRFKVLRGGSLYITKTYLEDAGSYTVIATNGHGAKEGAINLQVLDLAPPERKWATHHPHLVTLLLGWV